MNMAKNKYPDSLRCFIRPSKETPFLAVCLELDLVVGGETLQDAKQKLGEQMESYLAAIDESNIKDLLPRMAPAKYHLQYHGIKILISIVHACHWMNDKYQSFKKDLAPIGFHLIPA